MNSKKRYIVEYNNENEYPSECIEYLLLSDNEYDVIKWFLKEIRKDNDITITPLKGDLFKERRF